MKNKALKLGKRAQALLEKQLKSYSEASPSSFDEFYDAGADNEESGDRWLGSDLAKSLRFYQKAYTHYLDALACTPLNCPHWDCSYNCARLLFHVYHTYTVGDGVNVEELPNVAEVFAAGSRSVVQPLSFIIDSHRQLLDLAHKSGQTPSSDLLFNTCIALTEAIEVQLANLETPFEALVQVACEAIAILCPLLQSQLRDMSLFISELETAFLNNSLQDLDGTTVSDHVLKPNGQEQFTNDETVVQPTDLFETVMAAYKLSIALKEGANTLDELNVASNTMRPLELISEPLARELMQSFCETSAARNDMVANISADQARELGLAHAYLESISITDLDTLLSFWKGSELPESAERYMSAADSIQHFLDRSEISLVSAHRDISIAESFSRGLLQISLCLKRAQELLNERLGVLRKSLSQIGVGSLIAQISEVCLYRAETELQRCQIRGIPSLEKNALILFGNAKTLLKNAMTIANTAGGLRERASEIALRELRKVDAVARLCILENKTSLEELDGIMGRERWMAAMPKIASLGYYDAYGVDFFKSVCL